MTRHLFVLALIVPLLASSGCKKDDGGTEPPPVIEDFTFPASSDTALTLYSGTSSVGLNQTFDVKVICYNVSPTFGAAFEVSFSSSLVQVLDIIVGPFIGPADSTVQLKQIENASGRVSFGVSFRRGSGLTSSGSGIPFKIRCKAIAAGTAQFTFNQSKVLLLQADGSEIANFRRLQFRDLTITTQ
jgi:hypothetical protein